MIVDHRDSLVGGDNVDGRASTGRLEFYKASLKYGEARKDAQLWRVAPVLWTPHHRCHTIIF